MKQKLLYFLAVVVLITFFNVVFFVIAKLSGFGNNYSIATYLYMPLLALLLLLLLLLFLNAKLASIVYVIINLSAILFLLIKDSLESHDLLNDFILEDSRFCYVVINAIRKLINNETVLVNVFMYTIVFSCYYYLIFKAASSLVKKKI
ncbi:MAG: hypothetical protein WCG67_07885 [Ferruginibacter sp.]